MEEDNLTVQKLGNHVSTRKSPSCKFWNAQLGFWILTRSFAVKIWPESDFCGKNSSCKFWNAHNSDFAVKIRVANFETHTTRIFAVKIRVANFEMHTTRISVVKIRVANVKCEKNKWMSYMSHGISIFLYLRTGFHYWLSRESPDNIHKRISLESCYNSVRILHSQLNIRWYLKSKFRDRMFFFLRWTEIEKPEIEVLFRYRPLTI